MERWARGARRSRGAGGAGGGAPTVSCVAAAMAAAGEETRGRGVRDRGAVPHLSPSPHHSTTTPASGSTPPSPRARGGSVRVAIPAAAS